MEDTGPGQKVVEDSGYVEVATTRAKITVHLRTSFRNDLTGKVRPNRFFEESTHIRRKKDRKRMRERECVCV